MELEWYLFSSNPFSKMLTFCIAVSGSFEYGSNLKTRSRGMSYVAPKAVQPGVTAVKQSNTPKYPDKQLTAITVEPHTNAFYVSFSNGELLKFSVKKNEKESHLGLGVGGGAQQPGMFSHSSKIWLELTVNFRTIKTNVFQGGRTGTFCC